jgi:hypothetical protein
MMMRSTIAGAMGESTKDEITRRKIITRRTTIERWITRKASQRKKNSVIRWQT